MNKGLEIICLLFPGVSVQVIGCCHIVPSTKKGQVKLSDIIRTNLKSVSLWLNSLRRGLLESDKRITSYATRIPGICCWNLPSRVSHLDEWSREGVWFIRSVCQHCQGTWGNQQAWRKASLSTLERNIKIERRYPDRHNNQDCKRSVVPKIFQIEFSSTF